LRAIAAGIEERGIPAARGGKWSAVQVMRLLEAGRPFDVDEAKDGPCVKRPRRRLSTGVPAAPVSPGGSTRCRRLS